jgi:hypothetical protein
MNSKLNKTLLNFSSISGDFEDLDQTSVFFKDKSELSKIACYGQWVEFDKFSQGSQALGCFWLELAVFQEWIIVTSVEARKQGELKNVTTSKSIILMASFKVQKDACNWQQGTKNI